MLPEQGEVIDEIITKIRAGRMTRRTFLERAIAVGLSTTAATSLLKACGGTSPWGEISAAAVIVTIPLVIVVLFLQRRIVSGLTAGAVKG